MPLDIDKVRFAVSHNLSIVYERHVEVNRDYIAQKLSEIDTDAILQEEASRFTISVLSDIDLDDIRNNRKKPLSSKRELEKFKELIQQGGTAYYVYYTSPTGIPGKMFQWHMPGEPGFKPILKSKAHDIAQAQVDRIAEINARVRVAAHITREILEGLKSGRLGEMDIFT